MNEQLITIAQQVNAHVQTNVLCYDDTFFQDILHKRMNIGQFSSLHEYAGSLDDNPDEIAALLDALQVGYSRFFRNPCTFSLLQQLVLPALIRQKRIKKLQEIRVWSAACAAGQEAYSIAMLLDEALNINAMETGYRIFATDSNPEQIKAALIGRYPYENLENMNIKMFDRWIVCDGGMCSVSELLKQRISFSVFDLLNNDMKSPPESIFGEFDLIFCANVLFYYNDQCRTAIINKLVQNQARNGLIVSSETERHLFLKRGFTEVYPNSCIFNQPDWQ